MGGDRWFTRKKLKNKLFLPQKQYKLRIIPYKPKPQNHHFKQAAQREKVLPVLVYTETNLSKPQLTFKAMKVKMEGCHFSYNS